MEGYTQTILLDCNRRSSDEYLSDPYSSEKSIFSNRVGDGLKVDIGDKISLHSAYVSGRGVGGEVIEIKGDTIEGAEYTLPFTHINTIKTDVNASMSFGDDNGVVVDISASHKTFKLQDNEINVSIGYYTTTNGENYFHCPRRFDKNNPEYLFQSASYSKSWGQYYQNCYTLQQSPINPSPIDRNWYRMYDTGAPYHKPSQIANTWIPNTGFEPTGTPRSAIPSVGSNLFVCKADYATIRHNSSYSDGYGEEVPDGTGGTSQHWIQYNGSRISPFTTLELANDNSRYHIMVRGSQTYNSSGADGIRSVFDKEYVNQLNPSMNHYIQNGSLATELTYGSPASEKGLTYRSAPWTAKYIDYREIVSLSIEPGYDTPSNIAKTLTDQLQKVGQPKTTSRNLSVVEGVDTPANNGAINSFPITIKNESPTFKLFRGANPQSFSQQGYTAFQNASVNHSAEGDYSYDETDARNANQNLLDYYNAFTFIGVKRPDLFKLGRDLHGEYSLSDTRKSVLGRINIGDGTLQNRLGGYISWETLIPATLGDYTRADASLATDNLLITKQYWNDEDVVDPEDLPLHGTRLRQKIKDFMIAQGKYPELFDYPNYDPLNSSNVSASYTRFFHLSSRVYGTADTNPDKLRRGTYNQNPGNTGIYSSGNYFNQLGQDYWHPTTGISADSGYPAENLFDQYNYMMSNPIWIVWNEETKNRGDLEGKDTKHGSDLCFGCMVKYRHTDGKDYIGFLTRTDIVVEPNRSFARYGPLSEGSQDIANASFSVDIDIKFGWDFSANAYGCPIVSLYTGQVSNPFNPVPYNGPVISEIRPTKVPIKTSAFQNELYLGSISPLFNFDTTSNRFNFSDLHTPEYISQPYNAGSDADNKLIQDASSKAYKINKRPNNFTFCPDLIPYQMPLNSSETGNGTTGTISLDRPNINLKSFTIFDAHSGISFADFGITKNNWIKSLWNTLGFTFDQMNTKNRNSQIRNNDVYEPDMDLATTNAVVLQSDVVNYSVSYYGATMYQPNLPLTFTNGMPSSGSLDGTPNTERQQITPAITLTAESAKIIARNLPTKSTRPYYLIKSNILPNTQYQSENGDLPIVAVVTKINGYQDAFSQDGTQLEFTITKPMVINYIKTMITDPDGTPSRVDDSSGVIYKVQKQIKAQMNLVDEYIQQQQAKEQIRIQQDQDFVGILAQGGGYSAFQNLEERLRVANETPIPSGLFADPIAQNVVALENNDIGRNIREILSRENLEARIQRQEATNPNRLLDELFNRPRFQDRFTPKPTQEEVEAENRRATAEREEGIQRALREDRGSGWSVAPEERVPPMILDYESFAPVQVREDEYTLQGLKPPDDFVPRQGGTRVGSQLGLGSQPTRLPRVDTTSGGTDVGVPTRLPRAGSEVGPAPTTLSPAQREAQARVRARTRAEPSRTATGVPTAPRQTPNIPRPNQRGSGWTPGGYAGGQSNLRAVNYRPSVEPRPPVVAPPPTRPTRREAHVVGATGQRYIPPQQRAERPIRRTHDRPAFRPAGAEIRRQPQPPQMRPDRGQPAFGRTPQPPPRS